MMTEDAISVAIIWAKSPPRALDPLPAKLFRVNFLCVFPVKKKTKKPRKKKTLWLCSILMTLTLHSKTAILPFSFEMTCGAFGGPSVDVSIPIIAMALDFIDSHKYLKVYMSTAWC